MHGIMYLRKSREDEQYEKNTGEDVLQTHRERLSALCELKGITFDERAEVRSGDTIAGRPKFQQVLETDMPSGQYSCIIVTEISRLGRGDMEDAGRIYKAIINYNMKIVTPNKIYDPTNPADLRQLRFELFMSREEYENIKERLWNNRNYRATQGYAANYIVTLGFRQYHGNVEIIPEEADLVKEIFTMRAEGHSYQEIADYFNARGLRTKRGTIYHQTTIGKILRNPRYIGISRWMGKEYAAKHPAIIPLELWNTVQDMNNERRPRRRGTKEDNSYLVELYCHECGSRMYGERPKPTGIVNGTKKVYVGIEKYICCNRRKEPKCQHRIATETIHNRVFEELKKIVTNQNVFEELSKERESRLGLDTESLSKQIDELNKQIKSKNNFMAKVESDYEKGDLSAILYTKHIEKISKEIEALETRIRKIKVSLSKTNIKMDSPEELKLMLQTFLENWDNYPNKSKKIIIRSFFPRIEVDKQNNLYIAVSLPISLVDFSNGKRSDNIKTWQTVGDIHFYSN